MAYNGIIINGVYKGDTPVFCFFKKVIHTGLRFSDRNRPSSGLGMGKHITIDLFTCVCDRLSQSFTLQRGTHKLSFLA